MEPRDRVLLWQYQPSNRPHFHSLRVRRKMATGLATRVLAVLLALQLLSCKVHAEVRERAQLLGVH